MATHAPPAEAAGLLRVPIATKLLRGDPPRLRPGTARLLPLLHGHPDPADAPTLRRRVARLIVDHRRYGTGGRRRGSPYGRLRYLMTKRRIEGCRQVPKEGLARCRRAACADDRATSPEPKAGKRTSLH